MLQNKEKLPITDEKWNFNQTNYPLPSGMPETILLITNDGEVILENFDGTKVRRLITAISSSGLKITSKAK